MSKKYVPSGYQIINLEYPDIVSGTPLEKTPETEDEKILYKILSDGNFSKPILVNILCGDEFFSQFANRLNSTIYVGDGSQTSYSFVMVTISDDKSQIDYTLV